MRRNRNSTLLLCVIVASVSCTFVQGHDQWSYQKSGRGGSYQSVRTPNSVTYGRGGSYQSVGSPNSGAYFTKVVSSGGSHQSVSTPHNHYHTETRHHYVKHYPKPIDCVWSYWSEWGQCSKSCGYGSHTRSRHIQVHAAHGGKQCYGKDLETQQCHDRPCPVDCMWGEWEEWSGCSQTCSTDGSLGTKTRTRKIVRQAQHNGQQCQGDRTETSPPGCGSNECYYVECRLNKDKCGNNDCLLCIEIKQPTGKGPKEPLACLERKDADSAWEGVLLNDQRDKVENTRASVTGNCEKGERMEIMVVDSRGYPFSYNFNKGKFTEITWPDDGFNHFADVDEEVEDPSQALRDIQRKYSLNEEELRMGSRSKKLKIRVKFVFEKSAKRELSSRDLEDRVENIIKHMETAFFSGRNKIKFDLEFQEHVGVLDKAIPISSSDAGEKARATFQKLVNEKTNSGEWQDADTYILLTGDTIPMDEMDPLNTIWGRAWGGWNLEQGVCADERGKRASINWLNKNVTDEKDGRTAKEDINHVLTAWTVIHETGHNLGMHHDFNKENGVITSPKIDLYTQTSCNDNTYMGYHLPGSDGVFRASESGKAEKWSSCAVDGFDTAYQKIKRTKGYYCLEGKPPANPCAPVALNPQQYLVPHPTSCEKFISCQALGEGRGFIPHEFDCPPPQDFQRTAFQTILPSSSIHPKASLELRLCDYVRNTEKCRASLGEDNIRQYPTTYNINPDEASDADEETLGNSARQSTKRAGALSSAAVNLRRGGNAGGAAKGGSSLRGFYRRRG